MFKKFGFLRKVKGQVVFGKHSFLKLATLFFVNVIISIAFLSDTASDRNTY